MIERAEHNKDFLRITHDAVRDSRLSFEARGFLAYLLSFDDDWKFNVRGLASLTGLCNDTIVRIIGELKAAGYVEQKKVRNGKGQFDSYDWFIRENPCSVNTEHGIHRTRSSPNTVSPNTVNPNNKELSNIRTINHKKYIYGEFQNVSMSETEFQKLGDKLGDDLRDAYIERLSRYIETNPTKGKKYKSHYAVILTWHDKDKKKESEPKPIKQTEDIWDAAFARARAMDAAEGRTS